MMAVKSSVDCKQAWERLRLPFWSWETDLQNLSTGLLLVNFTLAAKVSMCIKSKPKWLLLSIQVKMKVLEIARWLISPSTRQAAQTYAKEHSLLLGMGW